MVGVDSTLVGLAVVDITISLFTPFAALIWPRSDSDIVLISDDRPSGAPVFRDLVADPPASTAEFRNLWKLYILSLVARSLRDHGATSAPVPVPRRAGNGGGVR